MAREREGEESKKRILEVSEKLFLEKGYDDTSISDITKELNMSKGVIYHHFKSKQDIFETILNTYSSIDPLENLKGNGLEKLQEVLHKELINFKKQELSYAGRFMLLTPRLIGENLIGMQKYYIPKISKLIKEGISDGSIVTEFPDELAEVLLLYNNFVIGLNLSELTNKEAKRKFVFLKKLLQNFGVDIVNDKIIKEAFELIDYLKKE